MNFRDFVLGSSSSSSFNHCIMSEFRVLSMCMIVLKHLRATWTNQRLVN